MSDETANLQPWERSQADQLDAARRYGGCGCPVIATTVGTFTPGQTEEPIDAYGAHIDHRPGCPAIPAEDAGLTEQPPYDAAAEPVDPWEDTND